MTDQTSAEIVRRLREKRGVLDNQWPGPSELELQAAALIEALSAEKAEQERTIEAKEIAAKAYYDNYRSEEARALAAESTVARLTSERDEARKQSAARLKVINEKLAERDTARNALRDLIRTAQLLQQNSEGCAVNHHGLDFEEQGLPGWLRDTAKSISAALVAVGGSPVRDERS
jgi:hypothetical protein